MVTLRPRTQLHLIATPQESIYDASPRQEDSGGESKMNELRTQMKLLRNKCNMLEK